MKVLRFALFLAVFALLLPISSWAAAGTGIAGTDHDFTTEGSSTTGSCTYCHTPHKALSTLLLWNHTLSSNTFTWDVSATTAGTPFPTFKGDTYKGPTAKCLSCHDGSVAIGDIAWWNATKPVGLFNDFIAATDKHSVGFGGAMKGNHPVAMPYPLGNLANKYNGSTTGAGAVLSEWQPTPFAPIRMFNDDGSGNITAGPVAGLTGIECSSCHDPHNKASVDKFFLRGTLTGKDDAYICLKCHIK